MFKLLHRWFSFPLLWKELTEQANRKRTYVIRCIYCSILFGLFVYMMHEEMTRVYAYNRFRHVNGGNFLGLLAIFNLFSIFILLPAFMSGVITREKERNSFELILLTGLSPTKILLEKYLSRMLPMFLFVQVAVLPLLAVCYSLGGLSLDTLFEFYSAFFALSLYVGSVAICVSCFFHRTLAAVIFGYVLSFAGFACGIAIIIHTRLNDIYPVVIMTIAVSIVILLISRLLLVYRALSRPRFSWRKLFTLLDRVINKLNNTFAAGIVLVKEKSTTLPDQKPVYWRELRRTHLDNFRFLIRQAIFFLGIFIISVAFLLVWSFSSFSYRTSSLYTEFYTYKFVSAYLWLMLSVYLALSTVSSFTREKQSQTMDVLLTTPLSDKEILGQKMSGSFVLMKMILVIMAVPVLFFVVRFPELRRGSDFGMVWFFVCYIASLIVTLILIRYLCAWIGLLINKPNRAFLTALLTVVAIQLLPLFLLLFTRTYGGRRSLYQSMVMILQPVSQLDIIVSFNYESLFSRYSYFREQNALFLSRLFRNHFLVLRTVSLVLYAALSFVLYWSWYRFAPRFLGRNHVEDLVFDNSKLKKVIGGKEH